MKIRYTFAIIIAFAGLCSLTASAQVGINQENPKATLDIQKSSNFATEKGKEGVLIPRLSYTELKEMTETRYYELEASTLVYVKEKTDSETESSNDTYKKAMKDVGEAGFYYWNPKFVSETYNRGKYSNVYKRREIIKKWVRLSDKAPREKPLITIAAETNAHDDISDELKSGKVLRGTYGTVQKDRDGVNYTYTGLIRIISQLYWTEKDSEKLILKPRQEETKFNFHNGQTLFVEDMPLLPIFLHPWYNDDYVNKDMEYIVEKRLIYRRIVVNHGKLIAIKMRQFMYYRMTGQPFYLFANRNYYNLSGFKGVWNEGGNTLDERWTRFTNSLDNPYGSRGPIGLSLGLYAIELLPILVTEDSDIKPW